MLHYNEARKKVPTFFCVIKYIITNKKNQNGCQKLGKKRKENKIISKLITSISLYADTSVHEYVLGQLQGCYGNTIFLWLRRQHGNLMVIMATYDDLMASLQLPWQQTFHGYYGNI